MSALVDDSHYLRDETKALAELLPQARLPADRAARVQARARVLVETVRAKQTSNTDRGVGMTALRYPEGR